MIDDERRIARDRIERWMREELRAYADGKWDRGDPMHTDWSLEIDQQWRDFVGQYMHRSWVLTTETNVGRQALLKALVTLFEMCVTMSMNSPLPAPGYPSGEIH